MVYGHLSIVYYETISFSPSLSFHYSLLVSIIASVEQEFNQNDFEMIITPSGK
jgi:hypothetical protein